MRQTVFKSLSLGFSAVLLAGTVGCGTELENMFQDEQEEEQANQLDPAADPSRSTNVSLNLQSTSSGFALSAATTSDFVIQLTSCSSGYTTTVTSTTASPVTDVALYTGDGGCLAELQQFDWSGVTYTKQGGGNLASGSALFTDGASNELYVSVGTQLDATIVSTSEAVFLISEVLAGSDYTVSGYSESADLTVTLLEAPEVEIPATGVTLNSIHATTGVATFDVHVQCVNTNSPDATTCQTPGGADQAFTNMKAKIITDVTSGTLTYSQADAAMAAGATSILAGDLSTAAPITTEGFTVQLAGEGQLYANRNMLLIIEYTDPGLSAKSYRYFNVDIGDPQ